MGVFEHRQKHGVREIPKQTPKGLFLRSGRDIRLNNDERVKGRGVCHHATTLMKHCGLWRPGVRVPVARQRGNVDAQRG